MGAGTVTRWAAVLVGVEGVLLAGLAAWMGLSFFDGEVMDAATAVALIVLTAIGAAALMAFAVAIARDQGWGRSGAIVAQLLALAVALGAVTGAYAHPLVALSLAAPAVVVLLLVVAAARRSSRPADEGPASAE